ncbi:MAG TPA: hypothetical protein VNO24_12405 [Blastocatellia bacterium]|nr:hypothetical protein [Blastocatellia bacterium]
MSATQNPIPAAPVNLITNPPIGEFDAIYTTYTAALLSNKYYANRLTFFRRVNKIYEIVLAIGTSTAVAGWAVFQENPGKTFWAIFAGMITLLVILKPILQIPKDIEDYANLYTGYRALTVNLRAIVTKIRRQEGLTPQTVELFDSTLKQYDGLVLKDVATSNKRIIDQCKKEVSEEVPPGSLWYPPNAHATLPAPGVTSGAPEV